MNDPTDYIAPPSDAPSRTRLIVRFEADVDLDGHARVSESTEFVAFWRDVYGTIHAVSVPDDGEWYRWLAEDWEGPR